MSGYQGDFTTSGMVYVLFNTFDSNDPSASVTLTGLAVGDILIYKNGSITQRSSTAGFVLLDTDGIDFDGQTGIHGFSIDLSDNTDAGFYAAGGEYTIVVASITVDAATVNFVAGSFSIERTGGALALLKAALDGNNRVDVGSWLGTAVTNGTGGPDVNVNALSDSVQSVVDLKDFADAGYDPATKKVQGVVLVDTTTTNTDMVGTDNAALATALATAQLDLDTLTGADGATLATAQALYAPAKAGDAMTLTGAATSAQLVDDIWDEDIVAAHTTADTAGKKLADAGGAADPWGTALPGAYGAGTAGKIVGDNVNATISSRMAETSIATTGGAVDNVTLVGTTTTNTDMVGTDGALTDKAGFSLSTAGILAIWHQAVAAIVTAGSIGKLIKDEVTSVRMATLTDWINGGRLDNILDARMAEASIDTTGGAVDTVTTTTNLTNAATAGDLTAAMKASVNTEVDTALVTTTYAEPAQGAPAATASLKDKIGYLYKAWRNRSNQTSTTYQLFNDNATTVDHKAAVSDDATTAEKGEVATGP